MSFVKYKDIEDAPLKESDYLKTGIATFDRKCLGFGKGQLIIITGTRGGGKTSLLGQIKLNFVNNGYYGLEYNLEMTNKRAKQWIVLQACGKDNLKTRITDSGKTLYLPKTSFITDKICEWLDDKILIDDNETYSAKKILEHLKQQLDKGKKVDYVIIDNLFRMDIADFGNEKYLAQTALVKQLQALCQKKEICLILVAHPNKIKSCPRIEDVSGSGDLVNACDTCIIIHRVTNDFKFRAKEYFGWDDNYQLLKYDTLFEIAKDREFGEEGTMIGLYFENESKRFLNQQGEKVVYDWDKESKQAELIPIEDDGTLLY